MNYDQILFYRSVDYYRSYNSVIGSLGEESFIFRELGRNRKYLQDVEEEEISLGS